MRIILFILFMCIANSASSNGRDASHALLELRPGAKWVLNGENYEDIEWKDPILNKPTKKQFENAVKAVQDKKNEKEIKAKRNREYPDIQEQIDMILKGETTKLRNKRKAVNDKYPLP